MEAPQSPVRVEVEPVAPGAPIAPRRNPRLQRLAENLPPLVLQPRRLFPEDDENVVNQQLNNQQLNNQQWNNQQQNNRRDDNWRFQQ